MTSDLHVTVATPTRKQEDVQDSKDDEYIALGRTLLRLLTESKVGIIRNHWNCRYRQWATALVFSSPRHTTRVKHSMHTHFQGVYLDAIPTDEKISIQNSLTILQVDLPRPVFSVRRQVKRIAWTQKLNQFRCRPKIRHRKPTRRNKSFRKSIFNPLLQSIT